MRRTKILASVAFEAEKIRLRCDLTRVIARAALFAAAMPFLVGALIWIEYTSFMALRVFLREPACLAVAGMFNLIVAVLITVLAVRTHVDKDQKDAKFVRDSAIGELEFSFTPLGLIEHVLDYSKQQLSWTQALTFLVQDFIKRNRKADQKS